MVCIAYFNNCVLWGKQKKQKNEANDYIDLGYLRIVHGKLGQVYWMGFWESLAQFQGFG